MADLPVLAMEVSEDAVPPIWEWMPPECLPRFFECVEETDASNDGEQLFCRHGLMTRNDHLVPVASNSSHLATIDIYTLAGRVCKSPHL
jgi:hypothetical protein